MGSLTYFNFDIVIVMIVIFFAAYSFYRGFFRSFKLFLQILLSFTVIELLNAKLLNSADFHLFNQKVLSFANKLEKIIYISNKNLMSIYLIYALVFIVVFLLIHFLFMFFAPSAENLIIKTPKLLSRIVSLFLGLASAYIIVIVMIFSSLSFIPINNKGLSRAVINNPLKVTYIEKYNEMNLELESSYSRYSYLTDLINGQTLEYELAKLNNITKKIYAVDLVIEELIFPILQSEESKTIINDQLPISNLIVSGYSYALASVKEGKIIYDLIIEKEATNPNLDLIKSQYDFIVNYQDYIKFIFELNQELDDLDLEALLNWTIEQYNLDYPDKLTNLVIASKFYCFTNDWFYAVLSSKNPSRSDLSNYNKTLRQALANNDEVLILAQSFTKDYQELSSNKSEDLQDIYYEIFQMFELLKRLHIKFSRFDNNLSFSLKLSLCKLKFNPEKDNLFNSPIVWADINDTFTSCKTKVVEFDGSHLVCDNYYNDAALFSEYVFVSLADSFDESTPIDGNGMEMILKRFEKIINDDRFISEMIATRMIDVLIIDQNDTPYLKELYLSNKINDEAINTLINSDYQFISSISRKYLLENYLSE